MLCLVVSDWPALAVRRAHGIVAGVPVGVLAKGRLVSCDDAARAAKRIGLPLREVGVV